MWTFPFFRTTFADSGLLNGMTDCHSHILPNVDDGIQTVEEAIETLRAYERWGVREVWFTPHIAEDYPNRTKSLEKCFHGLMVSYAKRFGATRMSLRLASENMLDSLFVQRLEENDVLPVADNNHLLVETSYYNPPVRFGSLLDGINKKGYVPVLAHPERYHYMSMNDYETLCQRGVKLQLNLTSVVGAYGEEARLKSCALLKKELYSFVGSDLHRLEFFAKLMDVPVSNTVLKRIQKLINNI